MPLSFLSPSPWYQHNCTAPYSISSCFISPVVSWPCPSTACLAIPLCVWRQATYWYHDFCLLSATIKEISTVTLLNFVLSHIAFRPLKIARLACTSAIERWFCILPSEHDTCLKCTSRSYTTPGSVFRTTGFLFCAHTFQHHFSTPCLNTMKYLSNPMAFSSYQPKFLGLHVSIHYHIFSIRILRSPDKTTFRNLKN